jgi:hypothetical protein
MGMIPAAPPSPTTLGPVLDPHLGGSDEDGWSANEDYDVLLDHYRHIREAIASLRAAAFQLSFCRPNGLYPISEGFDRAVSEHFRRAATVHDALAELEAIKAACEVWIG